MKIPVHGPGNPRCQTLPFVILHVPRRRHIQRLSIATVRRNDLDMARTQHIEDGNARAAQQRRDGAARARDWRAAQRQQRKPLPRAVDAALVEAMSFELAAAAQGGVNIGAFRLAPVRLAFIARLALERDGYDPAKAERAVTARLKRREPHTRPHHVPSLSPGDLDRIPPPVDAEQWSIPIDRIAAFLGAPSRIQTEGTPVTPSDAVTAS